MSSTCSVPLKSISTALKPSRTAMLSFQLILFNTQLKSDNSQFHFVFDSQKHQHTPPMSRFYEVPPLSLRMDAMATRSRVMLGSHNSWARRDLLLKPCIILSVLNLYLHIYIFIIFKIDNTDYINITIFG